MVNAFMKQDDQLALAATLTMFVGVFLLRSTSLGLLLIAVGALVMFVVLLRAFRKKQ